MKFKDHCIKIDVQSLIFFMIIFPFCTVKFRYASFSGTITFLYEVLKLCSLAYFLIKFKNFIDLRNGLIWTSLLYELFYLIPSVFRGNLTGRTFYLWFKESYTFVFTVVIFCTLLKINYRLVLNVTYYILSIWIILHVLVLQISNIEILGLRTRFGDYFIIAITVLLVLRNTNKEKLKLFDYIFILCSIYFIIYEKISTMLVLIVVFALVGLFGHTKVFSNILQYFYLVITAFVINFAILFGRIQKIFSWLIVDILHEDISLNSRTYIWDAVISNLKALKFPLFGKGAYGECDRVIDMYVTTNIGHLGSRQAHNQVLSILYWSGLGGLISYIFAIILSGKNLLKCNNKRVVQYFSCGMFLLCLSMITELSGDTQYFWIYLSFISCAHYLNVKNSDQNEEKRK